MNKEIWAYALQNAIDYGKADASKILPKLFQHGLDKKDISKVMPDIKKIVSEVNALSVKDREKEFSKYKKVVKKKEVKERDLPDLKISKKPTFRMAPFPSGALHLGNAKTFILNALYAEKYKGNLVLVMDDTIGSDQKPLEKESYKLIEDAFKWLGVEYKKPIVYKSDRLKIYYEYAEKLIEKGYAYVDYSPVEEMREMRAKGVETGDRRLPVDVQMARWKEMPKLKEGEAVLRLKTNMQHPNPAFRDRILFKISDRKHPRVGKKYRVWPSLEMSWAVDDHLLGMTHILRGNDLAMETEMEKFIWDIFKWKHPEVIHTGLVKITGAKISKSKARAEVMSGEYSGWDDPRTWSIQSLKRRGIKPEAIKEFVREIGANRQDITVPVDTLYSINRKMIDSVSDRYSFVKDPVEIKVKSSVDIDEVSVPVHPERDVKRKIKVGKIFISREDFDKNKGKEVRLLHLYNVKLDKKSEVTSLDVKNVPKLNWVSDFKKAEVIMPDGSVVKGAVESSAYSLKKGTVVQFERFGFVSYDGRDKEVLRFLFAHR